MGSFTPPWREILTPRRTSSLCRVRHPPDAYRLRIAALYSRSGGNTPVTNQCPNPIRFRFSLAIALLTIAGAWSILPQQSLAQLQGNLIVTITSPTSGSTVSGTTPVSANVSIIGNLLVAGVQFKLDGANLGAEDTTSPYSVSWNTTSVANGSHSLTAVARDAAGNVTTSSADSVTVSNVTPD